MTTNPRSRPPRSRGLVAALLALAFGLGACQGGGDVAEPLAVKDAKGMLLAGVVLHNPGVGLMVSDATFVLTGLEATYGRNSVDPMLVLFACADAETVEESTELYVLVIPERLATPSIRSGMDAGEYDDFIVTCPGSPANPIVESGRSG